MSDGDIFTTMSKLNDDCGYNIADKLMNRRQTFQRWKLFIICLELFLHIISSFVPPDDESFLILIGDPGFYTAGRKLRNPANSTLIFYKFNLAVSQLFYLLFNYDWIVLANRLFHQIDYIHITHNIVKTIERSKRIIKMVSFLYFFLILCVFAINPDLRRHLSKENYWKFIYGLTLIPLSLAYHCYFSGLFLVKLYLLLRLSTELSVQFTEYNRLVLSQTSSKHVFLHQLKQFALLYLLIQHLNSQLKRLYFVTSISIFIYTLHLVYVAIYTDIHGIIKLFIYVAGIPMGILLMFLSTSAGSVDIQLSQLSTFIYWVTVIEKRFLINKAYSQVNNFSLLEFSYNFLY